jgi:hypothetical protein
MPKPGWLQNKEVLGYLWKLLFARVTSCGIRGGRNGTEADLYPTFFGIFPLIATPSPFPELCDSPDSVED